MASPVVAPSSPVMASPPPPPPPGDSSSSPRQHRKRQKVALFEDSGMTEEDRRRVRLHQRNLHQKIVGGPLESSSSSTATTSTTTRGDNDEHQSPTPQQQHENEETTVMDFLAKVRHENNQLFRSVRYTREAVLDAENGELIVQKTLHEVDKLRQVARFDGDKLVRALRSKLMLDTPEGRRFDWKLLGTECGVCFNAPPTGVRFLAGSIDVQGQKAARKQRAKVQRHKAEDEEEIRPEVVAADAAQRQDADALSAAEKDMKDLRKLLKKRSLQALQHKMDQYPDADDDVLANLEAHGREVDGVQFLFNPRSFTQTVENIFNFSFLVKKGGAAVGVRSPMERDAIKQSGLWVALQTEHDDDQHDAAEDTTQAVVSFTMNDWRRICQAHALEKCDIPHRTGSRHQRAGQSSQSQR